MKKELVQDVAEVQKKIPRIMKIKMLMGKMFQVVSVYTPQGERQQGEKEALLEKTG